MMRDKMNTIIAILANINRIYGQNDYEKMIEEHIDDFWNKKRPENENIKIKVIYDNVDGLNHVISRYNNVEFQGENIIINNDEDSFSIINGDCIKRIDIKDIS